jgi:hypothetical protein
MKELEWNKPILGEVQTSQDIVMRCGRGYRYRVRCTSYNLPTLEIIDNGGSNKVLFSTPMETTQMTHIAKFLEEAVSVIEDNPLLNGGYKKEK